MLRYNFILSIGFVGFSLFSFGFVKGDDGWKDYLATLKMKAQEEGVSQATISYLDDVVLDEKVVELSQYQPEHIKPIWDYIDAMLSDKRKAKGKKLLTKHKTLFDELEAIYGVERALLVAIWGMESNFGAYQGTHHILQALATLGYQGRRKEFGETQILAALKIIDAGDVRGDEIYGSWAGAMGHTQFIPTTYLDYAVDFTKDGKRDIWGSIEDALASTAYYLKNMGWQERLVWGYEVRLPQDFDFALANKNHWLSFRLWEEQNVSAIYPDIYDKLSSKEDKAYLFLPAGAKGPAFLVSQNFSTILRYNNSYSYGLAVGLLSDIFANKNHPIKTAFPYDDEPLQPKDVKQLQSLLIEKGFLTGTIDGLIGFMTRKAIRLFQATQGLPQDGYATKALLEKLKTY